MNLFLRMVTVALLFMVIRAVSELYLDSSHWVLMGWIGGCIAVPLNTFMSTREGE